MQKLNYFDQSVRFVVDGEPLDIIDLLYQIIKKNYVSVSVSEKTWKIKFQSAGETTETNKVLENLE